MIQVYEYVMQHYALFLGGAILILLAIIGYYADKTNFGQGKNIDNKDDSKKVTDITKLRLSDVTNSKSNLSQNVSEQSSESQQIIQAPINMVQVPSNMAQVPINVEQNIESQNISSIDNHIPVVNENNLVNSSANDVVENSNVVEVLDNNNESRNDDVEKNESVIVSDENLSYSNTTKFDDEFNSILPKKELISSDLLNDIDDLDLGKTQKFDFNNIPNLEDIELPKIKNNVLDDGDIWKF